MSNEPETHLLGLGTLCSYPHCSLLDFLPFKCPHCPDSPAFCAEHFRPHCSTVHANLDRVAPNCPLCGDPVAIPPGEDPNVRMERHISRFCEVMSASGGQKGKGGSKICARGKCGKVLFAPIECSKCHKEFCPQHRFPNDHTCPSITSQRSNTSSISSKPSLRPSPVSATPSSSSAKSAPASSSRRVPLPPKVTSSGFPLSKPSIPLSFSVPDMFSKTDRVSSTPAALSTSILASSTVSQSKPSLPSKPPSADPMTRTKSASSKFLDPMSFVPPSIFATA